MQRWLIGIPVGLLAAYGLFIVVVELDFRLRAEAS